MCIFYKKNLIYDIIKNICISQIFKINLPCCHIVLNYRLEFEDRNLKKEKKELAAYEAFIKSQKKERTE